MSLREDIDKALGEQTIKKLQDILSEEKVEMMPDDILHLKCLCYERTIERECMVQNTAGLKTLIKVVNELDATDQRRIAERIESAYTLHLQTS